VRCDSRFIGTKTGIQWTGRSARTAKVAFRLTGTLNKIAVKLSEAALSAEKQKELDKQEGANELIN